MAKLPKIMPYIKSVTARGKRYEYFDTGVDLLGKRVLKPLPSRSDPMFAQRYAGLLAARTARKNVKPTPTMGEVSRAYQLSPKFTKRAHGTQDTYLTYLKVIEKNLGMAPVHRVTRGDVNKLLEKMQDRPSAANMVLLLLRHLFALAIKREWIKASPVAEMEAMETEDADYEPWPEDLLTAALADKEIGLPVALLYYTGQRIGDVCKMRWSDIHDDAIYVKQEKTSKEVWPPVHERLRPYLDAAPRDAETLLFGKNNRPMRRTTLRAKLQRWALLRSHEIVPHGLRKNAVNALLEHGCTTGETSAITGQTLQVVEHYAKRMNTRKMAKTAMAKWSGTKAANRNELENG